MDERAEAGAGTGPIEARTPAQLAEDRAEIELFIFAWCVGLALLLVGVVVLWPSAAHDRWPAGYLLGLGCFVLIPRLRSRVSDLRAFDTAHPEAKGTPWAPH